MGRQGNIERKTKETQIQISLDLDGSGRSEVKTSIPFMDHMLSLLAAHGFMDLVVTATGDIEVDYHHTVEDLGISFGLALKEALGEKKGIRRYGEATVPMDEALARVVMDVSNRPMLSYRAALERRTSGSFDVGLIKEFFRGLVSAAGLTMHVDLLEGEEPHHISEAIFKSFARALDQATSVENRLKGDALSTKGVL